MGCEPRGPDRWASDWVALSGSSQDGDGSSDCSREDSPGSLLPHFVLQGKTHFPEMFQTGHLLFYERFSAYQDYILGEPRPRSASPRPMRCLSRARPQPAAQWALDALGTVQACPHAWPCPPPAGRSLSARRVSSLCSRLQGLRGERVHGRVPGEGAGTVWVAGGLAHQRVRGAGGGKFHALVKAPLPLSLKALPFQLLWPNLACN